LLGGVLLLLPGLSLLLLLRCPFTCSSTCIFLLLTFRVVVIVFYAIARRLAIGGGSTAGD